MRAHRTAILAAIVIGVILTDAPARADAEQELQRGIKLLTEMEDARALEVLQRALEQAEGISATKRAQIHLHMGIAQSNLLNRAAAIESFRSALKTDPEVQTPKLISPKIKVLFDDVRRQVEQEARPRPAPAPAPAGVSPPPAPAPAPAPVVVSRSKTNWPAWVLLGSGAVAGGLGIAMGALSKSDAERAADLSLTYNEAKDYHDSATGRATAANILLAVGGAALVTSGVLFYLGWRKAERTSAAVVPLEGGVLVQITGTSW